MGKHFVSLSRFEDFSLQLKRISQISEKPAQKVFEQTAVVLDKSTQLFHFRVTLSCKCLPDWQSQVGDLTMVYYLSYRLLERYGDYPATAIAALERAAVETGGRRSG